MVETPCQARLLHHRCTGQMACHRPGLCKSLCTWCSMCACAWQVGPVASWAGLPAGNACWLVDARGCQSGDAARCGEGLQQRAASHTRSDHACQACRRCIGARVGGMLTPVMSVIGPCLVYVVQGALPFLISQESPTAYLSRSSASCVHLAIITALHAKPVTSSKTRVSVVLVLCNRAWMLQAATVRPRQEAHPTALSHQALSACT